jgi:hypothetical protein
VCSRPPLPTRRMRSWLSDIARAGLQVWLQRECCASVDSAHRTRGSLIHSVARKIPCLRHSGCAYVEDKVHAIRFGLTLLLHGHFVFLPFLPQSLHSSQLFVTTITLLKSCLHHHLNVPFPTLSQPYMYTYRSESPRTTEADSSWRGDTDCATSKLRHAAPPTIVNAPGNRIAHLAALYYQQ